uniref:uncharacterized protein LOC120348158 isoform X3 n=1 Tax=Styela clava TaxID=7725 RepID=UPI001939E688|nr:uncharacterized protein LOC120348158 isoform X3 [Styela clava]
MPITRRNHSYKCLPRVRIRLQVLGCKKIASAGVLSTLGGCGPSQVFCWQCRGKVSKHIKQMCWRKTGNFEICSAKSEVQKDWIWSKSVCCVHAQSVHSILERG